MKKISIKFIVVAILVAIGASVNCSAAGSRMAEGQSMRTFTMADGLPNDHVTTIARDSKGFVWIGFAGGGVARFDGYEFVKFDESNSNRWLRSNFVKEISSGRDGVMWVVGECGVDMIDEKTLDIITPEDKTGRYKGISRRYMTGVTVDSTGAVWISCPDRIFRLETDRAGVIERIDSVETRGIFHRGIAVRDVEGNGNVWIGMGNTIRRVRPGRNGGMDLMPVSVNLTELDDVEYVSDMESREGEVWISTDQGLYRYDQATDMVKRYTYEAGNERSLTQNFLTDIVITGNKRLLVSSLRGINLYNPIDDDFYHPEDGVRSQFVSCMFVDGDRLFVGTEGHGLLLLTPGRLNVSAISHDDYDPASLSANPVNAVVESPDGTLWVGTVEGGLNVRRPGAAGFHHITVTDGRLDHNSVSALALDGQNRIWVGTWGGGIDVLQAVPPFGTVMRLNQQTLGINISYIGSLAYDPVNDGMMIGSNAGILYYDMSTGEIADALPEGSGVDAFGFVGSIVDHASRMWLGSAQGLVILDLAGRRADGRFDYRFMRDRFDNTGAGGVEKPTCFYESPDSVMWVGTNGHGFYRVDIPGDGGKPGFVSLTTDNGLANNTIRGILGDNKGCLWVATVNGLSRFDPANNHFMNFTTADGLPGNQFYWSAAYTRDDGTLMFGTTRGIALIRPDEQVAEPEKYNVVFTKLTVGNRSMPVAGNVSYGRDVAFAKRVTIHERDRSLSVEFSALDFVKRDNATYSYLLEGFDKEWTRVEPSRRVASYTNLSPGDYVLKVMYHPEGYDPGAPVAELKVTVKPFFYRSTWFIALVAIVLIAMVAGFYYYRVAALKRRSRQLRREVEKSTSELVERNERLEAQNVEIESQKAQLTEMNRRVSAMSMDRIQFFTSITHEFRTPLTLIIGPIERALKLSTNPKVIEQLDLVERNSKYLLSLVNQLMDFRKIESGKMSVAYAVGNICDFVNEVVKPFKPLAAERDVKLRVLFHTSGRADTAYDEESIRKILINLVSNAIKYTPDHGSVAVYVACVGGGPMGEKLYLSVSDTGSGVPEEDVDRIFDRFYQVEGQLKYPVPGAGDSGIGLYLCRTIVELHGGTISVKNNHGAGCTFRVVLPIPADVMPVERHINSMAEMSDDEEARKQDDHAGTVVLVVEDNADMRRYICTILGDFYTVVEASDGREALSVLSRQHVDMIISDLMMPGMDGLELSRRVKENFSTSHIPILMLTAKAATESRIDSYRIGVDDYLIKPFDERVLHARIEGILRNRRKLQGRFSENMDAGVLEVAAESRDKKFIDQVMETLKQNYRNSYFEVGDFADALGISRSLLNKKLQSLLGQSAGQLVRNYRLNIARELIIKNRETRAMNIADIAYEVGFNDSKYFTRCFTKQYGVTPSGLMAGEG